MARNVTHNMRQSLIMSISTQLDCFKWSNLATLEKKGGDK